MLFLKFYRLRIFINQFFVCFHGSQCQGNALPLRQLGLILKKFSNLPSQSIAT